MAISVSSDRYCPGHSSYLTTCGGVGDGDDGVRGAGGADDDADGGAAVAFSGGHGAPHSLHRWDSRATASPPRTMRSGSSRQT